jgi:xylulokinase
MAKILSLDLGTTYFKFSLFDRIGQMVDTCRIAPPISTTPDGRMELTAESFAAVILQGFDELRQRIGGDLGDVEAITFASQTNSFLLLDAGNCPLTPIILWPDRRAIQLDEEVHRRCDMPEFPITAGFSGINFQCMPAKLLWLQEHSPEIWHQTHKISLISDYLTLLFTGKHTTEAGAAGLTGLVNIRRCQWYPEMLSRFAIENNRLPSIARAGTDLGPIDPQAALHFGLPKACHFVVGCLDQYAGAIGAGNVKPGMFSETTGTVLATIRCTDRFDEYAGSTVLQGPAFRKGWYWKMVFGEVSANYLEWYRSQLSDLPEFEELIALAESVEPGAGGLKLRTDVERRCLENIFEGHATPNSRGHQVRCILEAVASALCDQVNVLANGSMPDAIRCAGGAARSSKWLQIKADMLGITTLATGCPEPTSLGAAVLAQAALSDASIQQIASQWVSLKPPHRPDPQHHSQYRNLLNEPENKNVGQVANLP